MPTYVVYDTNKSYNYFSNNPHVIIDKNEAHLNLDDSKEVYFVCALLSVAGKDNLPIPPEEYLNSTPMKLFECTLEALNHYMVSNPSGYSYKMKNVYSHDFFVMICHADIDKYGKFLFNLPCLTIELYFPEHQLGP